MERPKSPATLWPGAFALGGAALGLFVGGAGLGGRLRDLGRACLAQELPPAAALERAAGLLVTGLASLLAAMGVGLALGAALRRRLLGKDGATGRGATSATGGALLALLAAAALLLAYPLHRRAGAPATGPDEALGLLRLVGLVGLAAAAAAGAAELLRERARR